MSLVPRNWVRGSKNYADVVEEPHHALNVWYLSHAREF